MDKTRGEQLRLDYVCPKCKTEKKYIQCWFAKVYHLFLGTCILLGFNFNECCPENNATLLHSVFIVKKFIIC